MPKIEESESDWDVDLDLSSDHEKTVTNILPKKQRGTNFGDTYVYTFYIHSINL